MPKNVGVDDIELRLQLFGGGVATELGETYGGILNAVLLQEPTGTIDCLGDDETRCFEHTFRGRIQCMRNRQPREQIAWQR